jgi:hypothetical protein
MSFTLSNVYQQKEVLLLINRVCKDQKQIKNPQQEMELIMTMMLQGGGYSLLASLLMIGADHHHVIARCSRTFFQSWPPCCRQLELISTLLL